MTDGLLLRTLGQILVAVHQVLDDDGHFDNKFPVLILTLARFLEKIGVLVKALDAMLLRPCEGACILLLVIDLLRHAADDLDLVHRFHAHAEIVLKEAVIDDRTADTHRDRADLQIGFSAHGGGRNCGTAKAEKLFTHVGGDLRIGGILYVVSVNTKGRKPLLCMGSQHGGKVHSTGSFGSVEAPHALDGVAVHIHRFCAVAPAGGNGQGDGNALTRKFLLTRGGLCHAADGGVCDHDLHRLAVRITQIRTEQICGGTRHVHRLILKRFSDAQRTAAAVNGRTDADLGVCTNITVFCHFLFSPFHLISRHAPRSCPVFILPVLLLFVNRLAQSVHATDAFSKKNTHARAGGAQKSKKGACALFLLDDHESSFPSPSMIGRSIIEISVLADVGSMSSTTISLSRSRSQPPGR